MRRAALEHDALQRRLLILQREIAMPRCIPLEIRYLSQHRNMMQIALRFQQLLQVLIDLTYRKSLLIHTSSPSKAPLTSQGMKETLHPSAHTFPIYVL